jgi:hypothetical protein
MQYHVNKVHLLCRLQKVTSTLKGHVVLHPQTRFPISSKSCYFSMDGWHMEVFPNSIRDAIQWTLLWLELTSTNEAITIYLQGWRPFYVLERSSTILFTLPQRKKRKEKETLVALSRRGCEPILLLLMTAYLTSHAISRIYLKKETKTKQNKTKTSSNAWQIQCWVWCSYIW